jgi:hypothetical protein
MVKLGQWYGNVLHMNNSRLPLRALEINMPSKQVRKDKQKSVERVDADTRALLMDEYRIMEDFVIE